MSADTVPNEEASNASVVANLVALAATGLFAFIASNSLPTALGLTEADAGEATADLPTLILALALIILALVRVSELRTHQAELRATKTKQYRLAYADQATDLHNRRYLFDVTFPQLDRLHTTILLLDLDGFKKANDLYGHVMGDRLLREVGKRIFAIAPTDAVVARLGGDEFAICLCGEAAGEEQATQLAAAIVAVIDQPFNMDKVTARVSGSVGIASSDDSGAGPADVLHHADIAMYEAKRLGRNRYVWFDAAMEEELLERNQLEAEIRQGIERGEFEPYFQPLQDLKSSSVKGFEVLARWNHPTKGLVLPDEFIPIAEANGMIAELSLAVMKPALRQARQWGDDLTIAVNISPVQFRDPLLPERIKAVLDEADFPATRLELEITETAILEDKEKTLESINRMRAMGIRISLDDFGTGYASFSQLRELPFDRIKIDKSFIATLIKDKQSDAIVDAITALGRSLSLPITAEGVEDEYAHELLAGLGCTDAQGWLYGKAMSAADVAKSIYGKSAPEDVYAPPAGIVKPTQERRSYARRGG